jgi:glycosyltransferase involved in cell wall biosynthesis
MKFSIIVPCYNEEKNLNKLVEEFEKNLIQKEENIEVILVNNGSTDNSNKVMEELKCKYNFIKIENVEVNQGYGYGILSGLRVANGDYLGWIHADLQFNPSEFLNGIEYLKQNNYPKDVFIKGLRINRPILDKLFTIGMSCYETLILKTKLWDINAQPTLMSKELFEKWLNPPNDFSLDLYAYYIAKRENNKIYRYKVVQHEREEGKSSWNTGMKSRIKLIKRVLGYSKKLKSRKKYEKK